MKRTIALLMLSYVMIGALAPASPNIAASGGATFKLTAKKFEFSPARITVKKGTLVSLELTSEDSKHGFSLPEFRVRADVKPGSVTRVSFTPDKTGTFRFACDVFCGGGHKDMSGTLIVVD
jgi:cytochrome c oxidase subunit 2